MYNVNDWLVVIPKEHKKEVAFIEILERNKENLTDNDYYIYECNDVEYTYHVNIVYLYENRIIGSEKMIYTLEIDENIYDVQLMDKSKATRLLTALILWR